jgi:hypothetical protein
MLVIFQYFQLLNNEDLSHYRQNFQLSESWMLWPPWPWIVAWQPLVREEQWPPTPLLQWVLATTISHYSPWGYPDQFYTLISPHSSQSGPSLHFTNEKNPNPERPKTEANSRIQISSTYSFSHFRKSLMSIHFLVTSWDEKYIVEQDL